MLKQCKMCGEPASVRLPYARLSLCPKHFTEYVERHVRNTIRRYKLIKNGDRVVLAISGGKDSLALLHILNSLRGEFGFELSALNIDLGIKKDDYSLRAVQISEKYCGELGIELVKVDMKRDFGFTIDEVFSSKQVRRPICSSCGVIKRYVTNKVAVELGASSLATGHNLDDESTVLLSNYVKADIDLLVRSGPILPSWGDRMISRIKPLYETSEKEITLYNFFKGIQYLEQKCPYASGASTLKLKEVVNALEEEWVGSKIALVRSFNKKIKPILADHYSKNSKDIYLCEVCGYPTSTKICSFCRLKKSVSKTAKI
ncbi:MAG: TIGR00269 family protein [Candidatus Jordarchaeaceae archaeon]